MNLSSADGNNCIPPDSNRLVGLDFLVIILISIAICLWSQRLIFMSVLVPVIILFRQFAIVYFSKKEAVNIKAELAFWAICTVLGGFNDWNSVVHHRIYDYTVPHFFSFSSVPLWMLLYWGMILRFFARLARWRRLTPPQFPSDRVGFGKIALNSAFFKVTLQLLLVVGTRQLIYRFYLDPIWSWIPFMIAFFAFILIFEFTRHDLKLVALFFLGGPLIEILYIQIGNLHVYHLGWIAGVPLWIVLWWVVVVLIWKDLAFRIERGLHNLFSTSIEQESANHS